MPVLRELTPFEKDVLQLVGTKGVLRRMADKWNLRDPSVAQAFDKALETLDEALNLALARVKEECGQSSIVSLFAHSSDERDTRS